MYNLDGSLRGVSKPSSFPSIDKKKFGLKKIECEIWKGFVFIRLNKGPQPSVKNLMSPFSEELAFYKIDEMVPSDKIWSQFSEVNWKSVRDVDNEGYHVPMAHPSLQDLYGKDYYDEPFVNGTSKTHASFSGQNGRNWSVRNYKKFTSPAAHIPKNLHKSWNYYGIFPNCVIAVTPEIVQFYQEFPISTHKTLLRGGIYRHKIESREQRVARYLGNRIDNHAIDEDVQDRENGSSSPAFQRTSIENENASIGSVVIENDENICSIIKKKSSFSDSNQDVSLCSSQSSMDENTRSNDELKGNAVSEENKPSRGIENKAFTDCMVMMGVKYV